jgi:hypothetical protein
VGNGIRQRGGGLLPLANTVGRKLAPSPASLSHTLLMFDNFAT